MLTINIQYLKFDVFQSPYECRRPAQQHSVGQNSTVSYGNGTVSHGTVTESRHMAVKNDTVSDRMARRRNDTVSNGRCFAFTKKSL